MLRRGLDKINQGFYYITIFPLLLLAYIFSCFAQKLMDGLLDGERTHFLSRDQ